MSCPVMTNQQSLASLLHWATVAMGGVRVLHTAIFLTEELTSQPYVCCRGRAPAYGIPWPYFVLQKFKAVVWIEW